MAFDEDDLEVFGESRKPPDRGLDVALLVSRRNDHRRRLDAVVQMPERATDRVVAKAQLSDEREGGDETVDQAAKPQHPERRQQPDLALDGLEFGQRRQRLDVGRGQHVLRRLGQPQSDPSGEFERRVPQMREVSDDQPGFARAQRMQVLEQLLAIVERAQRVPDQDEVEWSRQCADEFGVLDVADEERKIRMRLAAPRRSSAR